MLMVLVIFVGVFSLPTAISSLMNRTVIESTGEISTSNVAAKSGSARDIQLAVDAVVASGGIGNVLVPEGTFNFVEVGEPWMTVEVPAGVNVFGAPTERTSGLPEPAYGISPNDQVVAWKTVLVMPYDVPDNGHLDRPWFFEINGNGDANKPSRFSDIKLVGYREIDSSSVSWHGGIYVYNVFDIRVDHCFFKETTGGAVYINAPANGAMCGVIDHNKLINDHGYVEWYYLDCSVAYGITIRRIGTTEWDDNIDNVLGHYLDYTVFMEDNYFSRWRHCVSANDGVHYVFRHNTIEKDSVVGSLDGHGTYDYVGTRAMEFYENEIIDPIDNFVDQDINGNYIDDHAEMQLSTTPVYGTRGFTVMWRGGGGVFFNNFMRNYQVGLNLADEGTVEKCWPHDIWIWNNTWVTVPITLATNSEYRTITEGVDYFLYEKPGYTPYPYPHPLTLETMS